MKTRKKLFAALAAVALIAAGPWTACRGRVEHAGAAVSEAKAQYHCPMHPTYVSDQPGNCPICGMKLVPRESPSPGPVASPARKVAYYRSPMDPSVRSTTPAKDGMGMDFVAVYEGEIQGNAVAGRAVVSLTPERRQLLGLRSEPVRAGPLEREIRTVGRVAVDERRLHHIHIKYEGYVEHLHVDFTGQVRDEGRASALALQPRARGHAAGVPRWPRARRQQLAGSAIPSVARAGSTCWRRLDSRLLLWDIRRRRHRARWSGPERCGGRSTSTPQVSGYVIAEDGVPRDAGHARGHALRHRRPQPPVGDGRRLRVRSAARCASGCRPS